MSAEWRELGAGELVDQDGLCRNCLGHWAFHTPSKRGSTRVRLWRDSTQEMRKPWLKCRTSPGYFTTPGTLL